MIDRREALGGIVHVTTSPSDGAVTREMATSVHGITLRPVNAYTTAGWDAVFLGEVGASAALGGLLFVAVSINLDRIIAVKNLPGVAGAGVSLLLHAGGGLYWLVPGMVLSLVVAVINAWVLLVEVVR
ncbi:MAG TPA: hypothetical protein VF486_18785 [Actinomycetes bacterium]